MKRLTERYGPWALVTGASSGIGEAYARRLASDGMNVVIAARRVERLDQIAADLRRRHAVEVRTVEADLATSLGVETIAKAVADVDVGLIVSNAGSAHPGHFLASTVEEQLDTVRLNVTTTVEVAHVLGERLVARGNGALIFTGSTAAFAGVANLANYAAAKAFVGTFAEGLSREWHKQGVDVMVVHPGPTRTEMVQMDGVDFGAVPMNWMTPEQVVKKSLKALGRKTVLVPGAANKIQRFIFTRLLPRRTTSAIWGALMGRVTDASLQ